MHANLNELGIHLAEKLGPDGPISLPARAWAVKARCP